ncbi:hypothetical protein HDE_11134 [Halotydeus destructor]|nr:hypothetical protein HDE_11134 [Halotydeus destructor]
MELVEDSIPSGIAAQGTYFERHLKGNARKFVEAVNRLEQGEPSCERKMDLIIVLDASGSIGAPNFVHAKQFVADLIDNLNLNTSRIGLIVYDDSVYPIFGLNNKLEPHVLKQSVLNVQYYGE